MKWIRPGALRALLSSIIATLIGCGEPQADLSSPKTHRSGAITFQYPKNWKITDDSATPDFHYIFVETPGDALVIVQVYSLGLALDLEEFSKEFSAGATKETTHGEITQTTFSEITEAGGYEWITENFRLELLGESVPNRCLYGTKVIGDRRVFLIFNGPTDDFAKTNPGFELISGSLRAISEADGG